MIELGLPFVSTGNKTVLSKLPESRVHPSEDGKLQHAKENTWCNDHHHILDKDIWAYVMKNPSKNTSLNLFRVLIFRLAFTLFLTLRGVVCCGRLNRVYL